jgi:hypothetical protein
MLGFAFTVNIILSSWDATAGILRVCSFGHGARFACFFHHPFALELTCMEPNFLLCFLRAAYIVFGRRHTWQMTNCNRGTTRKGGRIHSCPRMLKVPHCRQCLTVGQGTSSEDFPEYIKQINSTHAQAQALLCYGLSSSYNTPRYNYHTIVKPTKTRSAQLPQLRSSGC